MMLALCYILAYLAGSIPTSIITCRVLKGIDIREHGSGNAGATNVYRVMGFKVALFVLVIDALKGVFGVLLPGLVLGEVPVAFKIGGGLFAIVGHIWTLFAGFKGGKGVGPALGVFLALMPVPALSALACWIVVVAMTRIVSVASMVAGLFLFIVSLSCHVTGRFAIGRPEVAFSACIAVLLIITHRKNIVRLMQGKENKLAFGKKDGAQ
ncbi:MAG: glycerol-3-phosphate 1-O-acyltransferase PlsY [Fibrobacterota bacterium]